MIDDELTWLATTRHLFLFPCALPMPLPRQVLSLTECLHTMFRRRMHHNTVRCASLRDRQDVKYELDWAFILFRRHTQEPGYVYAHTQGMRPCSSLQLSTALLACRCGSGVPEVGLDHLRHGM